MFRPSHAFFIFFLFLLIACTPPLVVIEEPQTPMPPRAPRTLQVEREVFHQQLIHDTIEDALRDSLRRESEDRWKGAFWGMELARYRSSVTDSAIIAASVVFSDRSRSFQRAYLQVLYALYPSEFHDQVLRWLPDFQHPKLFAMAAYYLLLNDLEAKEQDLLMSLSADRLIESDGHPIMMILRNDLALLEREHPPNPPLYDLLHHDFNGHPVLFSFQPMNRNYSGVVVVRDSAGNWLADSLGMVAARQLARSGSNLPWILTNGNTPPGIYSFQGFDVSTNVFIGPTPNLQLVMPHEVAPEVYFHGAPVDSIWNLDDLMALLPESWSSYLPAAGTWFAGKAGRGEIIAHGTTINPDYYADEPYYPLTPSLGCLTGLERWSPETGNPIESDQARLVAALQQAGIGSGYLMVVELTGIEHNLTIAEIHNLIAQ